MTPTERTTRGYQEHITIDSSSLCEAHVAFSGSEFPVIAYEFMFVWLSSLQKPTRTLNCTAEARTPNYPRTGGAGNPKP